MWFRVQTTIQKLKQKAQSQDSDGKEAYYLNNYTFHGNWGGRGRGTRHAPLKNENRLTSPVARTQ